MGQKVNPIGFRLLSNKKKWDSNWYDTKNYASNISADIKIRKFIEDNYSYCGISKVVIERTGDKISVYIKASRPGAIIGKKGHDIENIKDRTQAIVGNKHNVSIKIVEVDKPDSDARLVAKSVAKQIEKRISFRKAMKKAIQSAGRFGVKGIKISCAGRLGGAEIARTEKYKEGSVPLHSLRDDIDYSLAEAKTIYGIIGVKVWIHK